MRQDKICNDRLCLGYWVMEYIEYLMGEYTPQPYQQVNKQNVQQVFQENDNMSPSTLFTLAIDPKRCELTTS